MRGSAQPAFTCSNSIELTSTMYKVNARTRCLLCWLLTDFTPCFSVPIADFEQVNAQWVEGPIDVLLRWLQSKDFCKMLSNCMMSKTRRVTKICRIAKFIDTLNTWRKRFIMVIIMLCNFEIFTGCQGSLRTFSKLYSKCNTVSIKFRKTLQKKRLPILKFSQDNPQNNFLNFLTWNRHWWNVPRILWKYYFVITRFCQKNNIFYYQIIHF